MQKKSVLLGMSGGVDSTAAALLLRRAGYEVVGATLMLQQPGTAAAEKARRDLADARAAAELLGIRHLVLDWRAQFREDVIAAFAADYTAGRTPNPCVTCNRLIKFPSLWACAEAEGIDYIATGHYAVISQAASGRWRLQKAKSGKKDQSYVLYALTQQQLARTLLPLGGYEKPEIRAIAEEAGLPASQKADSQDICFVPDGDYCAFLEAFTGAPPPPGDFIDAGGVNLGPHWGLWHYTVGQRKGLRLNQPAPVYVRALDAATGNVLLGGNESLFSSELYAADLHWIDFDDLDAPVRLHAKIRYNHTEQPVLVTPLPDGGVHARFDAPQRAITPGQAVVFYDGDFVIGGGTILLHQP